MKYLLSSELERICLHLLTMKYLLSSELERICFCAIVKSLQKAGVKFSVERNAADIAWITIH
jgi:hypothetical protein